MADYNFPKYVDLLSTASGYGAECMNCSALGYLKEVQISTIENKECVKTFPNLYKNQICAIDSKLKNGTSNFFYLTLIMWDNFNLY